MTDYNDTEGAILVFQVNNMKDLPSMIHYVKIPLCSHIQIRFLFRSERLTTLKKQFQTMRHPFTKYKYKFVTHS